MCLLDCSQAIGIGQGKIPDNDLSASSSYDDLSQGARGRLNIEYQPPQKSGWCAKVNDQNQYLQIDLGKSHKIIIEYLYNSFKVAYTNRVFARNVLFYGLRIVRGTFIQRILMLYFYIWN